MSKLESIKELIQDYLEDNSVDDILEILHELTGNMYTIESLYIDDNDLCKYLQEKLFSSICKDKQEDYYVYVRREDDNTYIVINIFKGYGSDEHVLKRVGNNFIYIDTYSSSPKYPNYDIHNIDYDNKLMTLKQVIDKYKQ
jgi:hypothetical protein